MAIPFRRVSEVELRERFNRLRYHERAQAGEIFMLVEREEPSSADWLPEGTLSQVIHYYTTDLKTKLAIVHQYLRPDGTLGASGMPDPKLVYEDGAIYALDRKSRPK